MLKDGLAYTGLNLGQIPSGVRAVQWYGNQGEVEFSTLVEQGGLAVPKPNEKITDLAPFQPALDAWQAAHAVATQPAPPPTAEQLQAQFTAAIQKRLDDFAKTRSYDNVGSLSKYANLTDAEINSLPEQDRPSTFRYRAECRHLLLKTAQTWATSERILAEVQAGTRAMPTSIADIEADLPVLAWPVGV